MATREDLKGKVVVITGASSGFGRGAAMELASAGASVVLAARRAELLSELANTCQQAGGRALAVPTDVSKPDQVARLAQAALSAFGRIDAWINNAGVGVIGRFEEAPIADHQQAIETDLMGTVHGAYAALRQFRQQGSGVLINVASVLGKVPAPYYASYCAAKFGVVGLGAALRQELTVTHTENIHVCTVMPMATTTPFFEHAANYTGHAAVPIPPVYEPKQVVDAIVSLVTDPQDEVVIGAAGKMSTFAHDMMTSAVEGFMGFMTHAEQIKKAPAAPPTTGAVHAPTAHGTTVRSTTLKP